MAKMATKEERQQYWREQVVAWQASGMGMAEFARSRGLYPKSLYYWRQVLRRSDVARREARTQPLFQRLEVEMKGSVLTGRLPDSVSEKQTDVAPIQSLDAVVGSGGGGQWPSLPNGMMESAPFSANLVGCRVQLPNGALLELTGRLEPALLDSLVRAAGNLSPAIQAGRQS